MGKILIYEKYKHLLLPATREVLEKSFDTDKVEHRITRATVKNSSVMPFIVQVRDRFEQAEAIHRICKELDHMVEVNALAGVYKNEALFYQLNPPVTEQTPGYDLWRSSSYNQHADGRFVGAMLHVWGGSFYELRAFYSSVFCTSEGEIAPFLPKIAQPKKCVCGIEVLYGDKSIKQMHADWCPLSVYERGS
jgi:hypothetical protein